MSDYKGAALMLDVLPKAKTMLGDKGYDADWFRDALNERGIIPCIPSKSNPCLSGCNPHPLYVGCAVIRQARVSEWKLMF